MWLLLITPWKIERGKVETLADFFLLGSKITADEIRRWLFLVRKAMTNLDNVLKTRVITMLTKVPIVKAMVFPGVTYSHENMTIKKAECWKIDAFELWCWRRLVRVPWTVKRSKQSILKEIKPDTLWKDWCWSSFTCSKQLFCWKSPWL